MDAQPLEARRLRRKEWALIALGSAAWIAIAMLGVWFVHQLTRPHAACTATADAATHPARSSSTSPRNAFQALTGQAACP